MPEVEGRRAKRKIQGGMGVPPVLTLIHASIGLIRFPHLGTACQRAGTACQRSGTAGQRIRMAFQRSGTAC